MAMQREYGGKTVSEKTITMPLEEYEQVDEKIRHAKAYRDAGDAYRNEVRALLNKGHYTLDVRTRTPGLVHHLNYSHSFPIITCWWEREEKIKREIEALKDIAKQNTEVRQLVNQLERSLSAQRELAAASNENERLKRIITETKQIIEKSGLRVQWKFSGSAIMEEKV